MELEIRQNKISLGDTYEIFTNGKRTHSAFTIIRDGFTVLNLQKFPSDKIVLTIEALVGFFGPKYIIEKGDNAYYFRTLSWYKAHYQCICGDKTYDIYAHEELRYSIYCNQTMVGYWQGQAFVILEGDKYKITLDANADQSMILSFCLIIDRHFHNDNSTINFNIGRLLPETKSFDENWRPKD